MQSSKEKAIDATAPYGTLIPFRICQADGYDDIAVSLHHHPSLSACSSVMWNDELGHILLFDNGVGDHTYVVWVSDWDKGQFASGNEIVVRVEWDHTIYYDQHMEHLHGL